MERKFKVGNTIYRRSRYGVGKEIGGKIYVHKNYVNNVISMGSLYQAIMLLPSDFHYNCVMINKKNPNIIRFDEAPDFDTAREPHPGNFIAVNLVTKEIRRGHSNMIWHHKWMWVMDDYGGFNVDESYQWSKFWTHHISHPSGSETIWKQQIKDISNY